MASARWYVVNVYSGFEKKVVQYIEEHAEKKGISDFFEDILVPCEEVVEIKKGNKKVSVERNYFPGYILIKMILTDASWHFVKNCPRVSGFLGANGKPTPMSQLEVDHILEQMKESVEKPRHNVLYEVGEQIRVTDGPFASFSGLVEEVDDEKGRMKVSVVIFGRSTPVDLEFGQVEKQ